MKEGVKKALLKCQETKEAEIKAITETAELLDRWEATVIEFQAENQALRKSERRKTEALRWIIKEDEDQILDCPICGASIEDVDDDDFEETPYKERHNKITEGDEEYPCPVEIQPAQAPPETEVD